MAMAMEVLSLVALSGFAPMHVMQEICLTLANASRDGAPCSLTLDEHTPKRLFPAWKPGAPVGRGAPPYIGCVPSRRIRTFGMIQRVTIRSNFKLEFMEWPSSLREMIFTGCFWRNLRRDFWPEGIIKLEFDGIFDQSIEPNVLPHRLQELVLAGHFHQPIDDVVWPPSLHYLKLGGDQVYEPTFDFGSEEPSFNHPIEAVTWPRNLRRLEFGNMFDQPVEAAVFPDGLEELSFGYRFNHPIEMMNLPPGLRAFRVGEEFNRPVDRVRWPDTLEEIALGADFCQPIEAVRWPANLSKLTLSLSCLEAVQRLFDRGVLYEESPHRDGAEVDPRFHDVLLSNDDTSTFYVRNGRCPSQTHKRVRR